MKIDSIRLNGLKPLQPPSWAVNRDQEAAQQEKNFIDYLKESLHQVDQVQKQAQTSALEMAAGDQEDIHSVMIAYEKAALALQLTIEVRNKVMEAYHELMRIQL